MNPIVTGSRVTNVKELLGVPFTNSFLKGLHKFCFMCAMDVSKQHDSYNVGEADELNVPMCSAPLQHTPPRLAMPRHAPFLHFSTHTACTSPHKTLLLLSLFPCPTLPLHRAFIPLMHVAILPTHTSSIWPLPLSLLYPTLAAA